MKINKNRLFSAVGSLGMAAMLATTSIAQPPEGAPRPEGTPREGQRRPGGRPEGGERPEGGGRPEGGPGGPGGREGMRGDPKMMAQMMIEQFDKDGDKKLNSEELIAALSKMRPPAGPGSPGGPEGPGGSSGPGGGPGGPGSAAWAENMFKQNDKDGDGKLTGDEIPERMRQNTARIDTNSDGSVDRAEIQQMAKNFAGGGAGGGRPPRDGQPEGGDRPARRPAAE